MKKKNLFSKHNAKIKDFEKQASSGMVMQEPAAIERRKKKRMFKIAAIVTAAVVFLAAVGGGIAGVLTINQEGSLFYNLYKRGKLNSPKNVRIEDFIQETDYAIFIKWDYVTKATDYTLELDYELYPDTPVTYKVTLDGRYVERKRGELRYRVKANNLTDSSEFTAWQTLDVKPLKLELPEITLYKDDTYVYYTWSAVQYKYFNDYGDVTYQFTDGGHFIEDPPEPWQNPPEYSQAGVEYKTELSDLRERCDIFIIRVRPLNYSIFWSTEKFKYVVLNEPIELFDIYELSDTWAEAQLDLTE